jgi:hypothetical protein
MPNALLDALNPDEKLQIKTRSGELAAHLSEWARRYPVVRQQRIQAVSLFQAAIDPRVALEDALVMAKMFLWAFAFDDLADERLITLEEFRAMVDGWYELALEYPAVATREGDETHRILLELLEGLARHSLFAPLQRELATHVKRVGTAMATEVERGVRFRVGGPSALPSLEEHIEVGTYSICVPLHVHMLCIADEPAVLEEMDTLREAARRTGACLRLYNDIQTLEKSREEGGVNSIIIVYHRLRAAQPAAPEAELWAEARSCVLTMARERAERCLETLRKVSSTNVTAAQVIDRMVVFQGDFYLETDYHLLSAEGVLRMLGSSD